MSQRDPIPLEAINDSSCRKCNGACWQKGTILDLDDAERAFLLSNGAELVDTGVPTRSQEEERLREMLGDFASKISIVVLAPEHPSYLLLEDCPYLSRQIGKLAFCTVYNDPDRPAVCDSFKPGTKKCLEMQSARSENTSAVV